MTFCRPLTRALVRLCKLTLAMICKTNTQVRVSLLFSPPGSESRLYIKDNNKLKDQCHHVIAALSLDQS